MRRKLLNPNTATTDTSKKGVKTGTMKEEKEDNLAISTNKCNSSNNTLPKKKVPVEEEINDATTRMNVSIINRKVLTNNRHKCHGSNLTKTT